MKYDLLSVTIRCTDEEFLSLQKAWRGSDSANRSQFIKNAINCYSMMNKNAEEPIFKNVKVL